MLRRPAFKAHLAVEARPPDRLVVSWDGGSQVLAGRLLPLLAPLLDGSRTVARLAEELAGQANALDVRFGVDLLAAEGLLVEGLLVEGEAGEGEADECEAGEGEPLDGQLAALRDTLGVEPAVFARRLAAARVEVAGLSAVPAGQLVAELAELGVPATEVAAVEVAAVEVAAVEVNAVEVDAAEIEAVEIDPGASDEGSAPLLAVLVDDYLDPRLDAVDAAARAAGRRWLPIKAAGPTLWLGPLFDPAAAGCWRCLAGRLAEHRPAAGSTREGAAAPPDTPPDTPQDTPAMPPGATLQPALPTLAATGRLAIAAAALQLVRWLTAGESPLTDGLITLDSLEPASARHRFVPRAACPRCGLASRDPDRPPDTAEPPPLDLQPVARRDLADGGWRSLSPEEVLRRFGHHVSPLTGIVARLRPHSVGPVEVVIAEHLFRTDPLPDDDRVAAGGTAGPGGRPPPGTRPADGLLHKSAGKGMGLSQARASALCEALERYSGVFTGDEPRRRASYRQLRDEVGAAAIAPAAVLGFSERQLAERERWNAHRERTLWVPEPFDPTRPIDWSPVRSVTSGDPAGGEVRWLPTAFCYYSYPLPAGHRFALPDSNGCAAGGCLEEAILQGFLELVERDAVAIWWYNRLRRPALDLTSFDGPFFRRMLDYYRGMDRTLHLLDLTHDLAIPAFTAVSRSPEGELLLGFGCHLDASIAAARAVTEVGQFLPGSLARRRRRLLSGELPDAGFLEPADERPRRASDFPPVAAADLAAAVRLCAERAASRGLETLVLDQTRPEIGLPVVKVVVPGLQHFWARLGGQRLTAVPVQLGWRRRALGERQLNPVHLLI